MEQQASSSERRQTIIVLFYLYTNVEDEEELKEWFLELIQGKMLGRIIVAKEGINGNLSCDDSFVMDTFMKKTSERFKPLVIDWKLDYSDDTKKQLFPDLVIKIQKELCASDFSDVSLELTGKHLSPVEFHNVLDEYWNPEKQNNKHEKELVVIDVRNTKEFKVGRFQSHDGTHIAIDPKTKMYSNFGTNFVDKVAEELKDKKVLMYCTGGIRCEKASAYLRSKGVEDVSQLSGGIHRYYETFKDHGYFKGKNFVFDARQYQVVTSDILGRCFNCSTPEDRASLDRVCTVCRDSVLVCDPCRKALQGVYFCETHIRFQHAYYYFLSRFSIDELNEQKKLVQQLFKESKSKKDGKGALQKQLFKISERIKKLQSGEETITEIDQLPRCRNCLGIGPKDLLLNYVKTIEEKEFCDCQGEALRYYERILPNEKEELSNKRQVF